MSTFWKNSFYSISFPRGYSRMYPPIVSRNSEEFDGSLEEKLDGEFAGVNPWSGEDEETKQIRLRHEAWIKSLDEEKYDLQN